MGGERRRKCMEEQSRLSPSSSCFSFLWVLIKSGVNRPSSHSSPAQTSESMYEYKASLVKIRAESSQGTSQAPVTGRNLKVPGHNWIISALNCPLFT